MAVEDATDRATFVDTDEFGVSATYAPAAGGSGTVNGIFDNPHLARDFGDSEAVPLSDKRPTFLARTADIPSGAVGGDAGDTLTVSGTAYRVLDLEPDGQGMTLIVLGK